MTKSVPALFQGSTNQLVILLLAGCLTTMTGSIVLPVFPKILTSLNLEGSWGAGVLASIHTLPSALSTVALGKLADRAGKLKILIPCLLLYGVIGISTVFFTTMPLLLTSRALLGVMSGGIAAATIGILGGMFAGETRLRILGYATGAMTIAAIIFPLLGGWIGATHWQYAFYPYIASLPLAVVAALTLKEPKSGGASLAGEQQLGRILQNPEIVKLYLFIGVTGIIVFSVVVYTPRFLTATIGAGTFLNGFVLAIRLVGAAIASAFGASRLARRFGQKAAVAFGFSLMAMTLILFPFLTDLVLIILTAILFGVGFGLITPNLYDVLAELAPAEVRTSVLAVGTGFNSMGQFVSPLILEPILKNAGYPMVFFAAAGLSMLACLLSLGQRHRV